MKGADAKKKKSTEANDLYKTKFARPRIYGPYLKIKWDHPVRNIVCNDYTRPFEAFLSLAAFVIRFNDQIVVKTKKLRKRRLGGLFAR